MSRQDPTSSHDQSNQLFFSEGKCVTETMYTERLHQVELEENRKSTNGKFNSHNLKNKNVEIEDLNDVEGRRIINVKHVGEQMFCWSCKSTLSLMDINEEKRYGVASIFDIPCRMCKKITSVTTDKQHKVDGQSSHFDCNTKIVIGCLNGGLGNTQINKVLTSLNIPECSRGTYQTHEKEISKAVDKMHPKNV